MKVGNENKLSCSMRRELLLHTWKCFPRFAPFAIQLILNESFSFRLELSSCSGSSGSPQLHTNYTHHTQPTTTSKQQHSKLNKFFCMLCDELVGIEVKWSWIILRLETWISCPTSTSAELSSLHPSQKQKNIFQLAIFILPGNQFMGSVWEKKTFISLHANGKYRKNMREKRFSSCHAWCSARNVVILTKMRVLKLEFAQFFFLPSFSFSMLRCCVLIFFPRSASRWEVHLSQT